MDQDAAKFQFHPDAASRFTELGNEILGSIRSYGPFVRPPVPTRKAEIHPVFNITSEHVIGPIKVEERGANLLGEETSYFWNSRGLRVGWDGDEFQEILKLVKKIESSEPLRGRVSRKFLLDETLAWSKQRLERTRNDALPEFLLQRSIEVIQEHEIWIPIYQTYSETEFSIGEVRFRSVSKALLDELYRHIPEEEIRKPELAQAVNRKRSRIQGGIAACIKVNAERTKAIELAHLEASKAVALLRFLSPVNHTCRIVSHCMPVGQENTRGTVTLLMKSDKVQCVQEASIEDGPSGWNIGWERRRLPGLLEALDKLASSHNESEFRSALYGGLLLHSGNSIATDVSQKIVFVTASIESMLLRGSQEPITQNLRERLAFLIGATVDERKQIIANVDEFYRIRSQFVHHGKQVKFEQVEVVDAFFFNVWFAFSRLVAQADKYQTKNQLLEELENRKLT